ncbi:MAG: phosphotransferase [Lachnospiraceae bacterium]|nr:phosphotransferase [Lachnospiraceae bacterium]
MKHKRLNRGGKHGWGFDFYPYYQMRIDEEFFHGYACLIRFTDGENNYWQTPKAGRLQVTGAGMRWMELIPDDASCVITVKYFPDGTHDPERKNYPVPADPNYQPSIWYVDITDGIETDEDGTFVYIDKYLDIIFTPEGDIKVDDRDELDAALASGEISDASYAAAVAEGERILKDLCEDIAKTDAWCAKIRRVVEERIAAGEPDRAEAARNEVLSGGREGKIKKQGDRVYRPANVWSADVHKFLDFLIDNGFTNVPKPYGLTDDGNEILSFVPGKAYNYPLPKEYLEDEMLIGAAKLLKRYHEVGSKYIANLRGDEPWMLPKVEPVEVMCHGDYAPYNVTLVNAEPIGIIDFDTLHPGPALWDIAYAVYRWVPFTSPENPDHYDDLAEQIRKVKVFLDAYGATEEQREALPDMMVKRLTALVNYMTAQAGDGNEDFAKNVEDGHVKVYLDDIRYIIENKEQMKSGIAGSC